MKIKPVILIVMILIACNNKKMDQLQTKIDSLEKQLAQTYRPGFGELMLGIQLHHAKLWYSGISRNWPLAEFEMHEIKESMETIDKYCSDREETKKLPMIYPAMDSLEITIKQNDLDRFKAAYVVLTNSCNSCHEATNHAFNSVTIPVASPVSNQHFQPVQ